MAPYQTGIWLAEYVNLRCQLCRLSRSVPDSQLNASSALAGSGSATPPHRSKLLFWLNQCTQHLSKGLLCRYCHQRLMWLPKPFEIDIAAGMTLPIQAATYYEYPMRQAIRAFKHQEDMTKLPLLLHALRQLPRPHGCHHDNSLIVPMPTTAQRLVKRGFDPVSVLSIQLSKHWQIPLWHGVDRIDNTVSQQGLTRAERLSNLHDAFAVTTRPPVRRLLLFDDVATTGASLQALGQAIHHAGFSPAASGSQTASRYQLFAYALAHGSQQ